VAILGPPNAGKSTLLNRILGAKLAIVTRKPQTTRSRILGIHSLPGAQILFLDTPGLHESAKTLNLALNEQVEEAADDCDVALLLVDLTRGWSDVHAQLLARIEAARKRVFVVGTKADLPGAEAADWPPPGGHGHFRTSARTGEGVEALIGALVEALPESPAYYPEDELSDRSLRFLVAELVREAAFEELAQELPYSLATEVVEFDESRPDLLRIRVKLLVERDSQKQIVIGRGGRVIKQIGIAARKEIERLVDGRVHLELWVKVEPRWAKRRERIKALGYV
jgi:GTP-binding protein Era